MTMVLERTRTRRLLAVALAAFIALTSAPAVEALGRMVPVIVEARDAKTAADLTETYFGEVDQALPIVGAVSAKVPENFIDDIAARAIVVADRPMKLTSSSYGEGLVSAYPAEIGAANLWQRDVTGKGVTVAMIDTGVSNVPDLAGSVVAEANFSRERGYADRYGHGTFQAGLIVGNGASSDGRYVGVAPDARLFSVKVANAAGETSLSQVLAGIQLVDTARDRFDIRVALLALSSGSPLPPELDPLTRALRVLWAHNVVVVVPAGNDGPGEETITSPGEDPVLITTGSVDDHATNDVSDDTVSDFSSRGPTRWGDLKPDFAAPGAHLVSLRAPGSTVDAENPSARVEDAYFKGSGTSMAAAVTAGAAALLLQAHPDYTPDHVKAVLQGTATELDADPLAVGSGVIDVADAVDVSTEDLDLPDVPEVDDENVHGKAKDFLWTHDEDGVWRWVARSWAARSWDARSWDARSWADKDWDKLETNARSWAARSWDARSWDARSWDARSWAARSWAARSWAARTWAARSWAARSWSDADWEARSWAARSWAARSWSARSWSARTWSARSWSDVQWSARSWSARTWSSRSWSAQRWA